jgi:CheY-like chemotaxis protein
MLSHPLFYFSTTLVWIDDDINSLTVSSNLFKEKFNIKKFVDSLDAYNFLKNYVPPLSSIPFITALSNDLELNNRPDHCPIDFNILKIPYLINYGEKSSEISLIVTDNNMPKMTGIELCKKIEHLPTKIIMLSGETGQDMAVSAFNDGYIDKFIIKSSQNINEELEKYINQLEKLYFIDKSNIFLACLEAEKLYPISDPSFMRYFSKWCIENCIIEFYLFDKNGCFLCVNKKNEIMFFVTYTDNALNEFEKYYLSQQENTLYEAIKWRKKIPFFGVGKELTDCKDKNPEKILFDFSIIEGREKYYNSIIKL